MFFKQLQQLITDIPSIIFSIKQGLIYKVTNDNSHDDMIIPLNMNMIINIHTLLMK